MNYVLDTNIILIYFSDEQTRQWIEDHYNPFGPDNNPIISVVTIGEIRSIALRNGWGARRSNAVETFMRNLIIIDVRFDDILNKYAEIDAFSQGKLSDRPLANTARNMGKNDLWIAATIAITNATLITTDQDFNHLHQVYFEVLMVERIKKK